MSPESLTPESLTPESLGLRAELTSPSSWPADELIGEMLDEIVSIYDLPGRPSLAELDPSEMEAPAGAYVVLWSGAQAVAGGGFRRLEERVGEIKRMYVRPLHRGKGVARVLLGALEQRARASGYGAIRLDTGPRQPHAQRLYERCGYRAIGNYNASAYASFWGEKPL